MYTCMQAEPFTQLDLADYACQEVQVSFAVTNEYGLSQFSDPVHIMVHGGTDIAYRTFYS